MPDIKANCKLLRQRIANAACATGRKPADITLLAVGKTRSAAAIRAAYEAGLRCFGENYLQEALDKMGDLGDLDIQWHFIGPLQANKTRKAAERFAWVHTIDRLKIARRLNEQRPAGLPPLNICLQVNVDLEDSKSGITPAELPELAAQVVNMDRLRLRGLMAIPGPRSDPVRQREPFALLSRLLRQLKQTFPDYPGLDTLSMGMSRDMEAAIAEGATIVRIGTDIFGPRELGRET